MNFSPNLSKSLQNTIIDVLITESSPAEPILLADIKDHLRITFTDDDTYLTALIIACRKSIENLCNVSMVNKTIRIIADLYTEFELPNGPVSSISAASYWTGISNFVTAMANVDYELTGVLFKRFRPITTGRYDISYSATAYVPDDLVLSVKQEIAFRYENRGDSVQLRTGEKTGICEAAEYLASPFKRMQWL